MELPKKPAASYTTIPSILIYYLRGCGPTLKPNLDFCPPTEIYAINAIFEALHMLIRINCLHKTTRINCF